MSTASTLGMAQAAFQTKRNDREANHCNAVVVTNPRLPEEAHMLVSGEAIRLSALGTFGYLHHEFDRLVKDLIPRMDFEPSGFEIHVVAKPRPFV